MSAAGPIRKAAESRDDWRTPPELFGPLHDEFDFDLDGAAEPCNAKCSSFLGPGGRVEDALAWDGKSVYPCRRIWVNPPYGDLLPWVMSFDAWATAGHTVVALLPANTDAKWFGHIADTAHEVRLLIKRVSFVRPDGGRGANTGGSMVAIWRPGPRPPQAHIWSWRWR